MVRSYKRKTFINRTSLVRNAKIYINTNKNDPSSLHPQIVLLALSAVPHSAKRVIFPNLLDLEISPRVPDSLAALFISPSLQHLRLDWTHTTPSTDDTRQCFEAMRLCTSLRSLRIDIGAHTHFPSFVIITGVAVHELPNLRKLVLPACVVLQPRVWKSILELPHLQQLEVTRSGRAHYTRSSMEKGLQELSSLKFEGPCLALLGLFIDAEQKPGMKFLCLNLTHTKGRGDDCVLKLLECIASTFPLLESLDITIQDHHTGFSMKELQPLLSLPQLSVLRLFDSMPTKLYDADIRTIALAFPLLTELSITPAPQTSLEFRTPPLATLLALSHVAESCRRIRKVSLYLDTSILSLPPSTIPIDLVPFSDTLEVVCFGYSEVKHTKRATPHLVQLFLDAKPIFCAHHGRAAQMLGLETRIRPSSPLGAEIDRESWRYVEFCVNYIRSLVKGNDDPYRTRIAELESLNEEMRIKLETLENLGLSKRTSSFVRLPFTSK